jgi:hypothetical protein
MRQTQVQQECPMPLLMTLSIAALVMWLMYRWFKREMARAEAELQRARRKMSSAQGKPVAIDLVFDEAAGVYTQAKR